MIRELTDTKTIDTPTVIPNVWEMPNTGPGWCDCGNDCTVTRDLLAEIAFHLRFSGEWLSHDEVIDLAMELWAYDGVCEFFLMVIKDSAKAVYGEIAEKYPFEKGLEIDRKSTRLNSSHWE